MQAPSYVLLNNFVVAMQLISEMITFGTFRIWIYLLAFSYRVIIKGGHNQHALGKQADCLRYHLVSRAACPRSNLGSKASLCTN